MSAIQIDDLLRRVELFRGLSREEVTKIFSHGLTTRVPKGDILFQKGATGNQMYVVLLGKVGVVEGKKVIATLATGDMFGEMALVTNEPRSATIVALEDTQLFVLSESTFERLMTKRVAIRLLLNIVKTLSHRIKDANLKMTGQV